MKYPKEEPSRRLGAVRAAMDQAGLDSLIVYSTQWKLEAIHYLTNYRLLGDDACLLLPLSGEPVLYIREAWDRSRALGEGWIADVRVESDRMLTAAGETARSHGPHIGVIGAEFLAQAKHQQLLAALGGVTFSNQYSLLDRIARTKTPWELDILRKCGALADEGFRAELEAVRLGISEFELSAEIEYAMRSRGADEDFQMIGLGRNLSGMNVPGEYRLRAGDLVLSEITPLIGCFSYATQLCRTVKLGPPTNLEREKYDMLVEALEASLAILRPGVKARDICRKQNEIIGAAGYEKYCGPPYMRSRGHNFGLGQIELSDDNELELQPNMVMVVHPNQFIPETGYLACGETILVTETGVERLNHSPARLFEA
jgi:Xaa-Pro dipeptidase